jgi:cytoskeletal protein CcmA (bactofilin family)
MVFDPGAEVIWRDGVIMIGGIDMSDGTLTLDDAILIIYGSVKDTNDSGTIIINGDVTIDGDVTTGKITSGDDPVNILINGSLDTDEINIIGNVDVTDSVNVNGDTYVDGDVTIGVDLNAGGDVTVTGNLTIGGQLITDGLIVGDDLFVEDDLTADGNVRIDGNLIVGGDVSIRGDEIIIVGDVIVEGDLITRGELIIEGTLTVGGIILALGGVEKAYRFTGYEITPDVTVTINGMLLSEDDFIVTFANNTDEGMAELFIMVIAGEHAGREAAMSFEIYAIFDSILDSGTAFIVICLVLIIVVTTLVTGTYLRIKDGKMNM